MRRGVLLLLTITLLGGVALLSWRLWPAPAPAAVALDGVPVEVPSGQQVVWVETIQGERSAAGLAYRFRFVAPGIARDGGTVSEDQAQADMQALCDTFALERLPATGPMPEQVIISLSDRPVPFGEPAPEATQFFEGYRIEAGKCVWELY
jgi:hypothetical protein